LLIPATGKMCVHIRPVRPGFAWRYPGEPVFFVMLTAPSALFGSHRLKGRNELLHFLPSALRTGHFLLLVIRKTHRQSESLLAFLTEELVRRHDISPLPSGTIECLTAQQVCP
jgi:hypothetical protein